MNAYGNVDPCPICGSRNVRWRNRRFLDVVFTYIAYLADVVGSTFSSRISAPGSSGSQQAGRAYIENVASSEAQQVYESRVGTMTARRFWKCPDCRQKGQVFDRVADRPPVGE